MKSFLLILSLLSATSAFTRTSLKTRSSKLYMAEEDKAAPLVSGEELEMILTEWDEPLVVDAYATW